MPSLAADLMSVYRSPMLDDMPPGTGMSTSPRWDYTRDGYQVVMVTPYARDSVRSEILLSGQAIKAFQTDQRSFTDYMSQQLQLLRMKHWFQLAYARGGYC